MASAGRRPYVLRVTAAFTCCGVLLGCGTQTATSEATEEQTLATVETSALSEEIRQDAESAFYQWYGSDADRAAAEIIVAYGLNGDEAKCMTEKGYEWDWRLAIQNAIPEDPLGPAIWTNEPMSRIFSNPLRAAASFSRAEVVMNSSSLSEEQTAALRACEDEAHNLSEDEIEAVRSPLDQQRLMAEWREGLREATASIGDYADYGRCMANADVPLLGDQPVTAENFQMRLRQHNPDAEDLPGPEQPSGGDSWRRFLGLEAQWLNADWDCRGDNYERAMSLVPAFIESFQVEHRESIAALEQRWARTRAEADELQ